MTQTDQAFIRAYAQIDDAGDSSDPPTIRSAVPRTHIKHVGRAGSSASAHRFVPHPHALRSTAAELTGVAAGDPPDQTQERDQLGAPDGPATRVEASGPALEELPTAPRGEASPADIESAPEIATPAPIAATPDFEPPQVGNEVIVANPSARRPLSEFAERCETVGDEFRPAFEVDAFRWSPLVRQLRDDAGQPLDTLRCQIEQACRSGHNVLVFCSGQNRSGCTSMLMAAGRALVDNGTRAVLVDADFEMAGLTRSLGIAPEVTWEDVLAGEAAISDAAVRSIDDGLTVMVGKPALTRPRSTHEWLGAMHAFTSVAVLRQAYDVVLIDAGAILPPESNPENWRRIGVDAAIVVHRPGEPVAAELDGGLGIPLLATVENGIPA